MTRDLRNFCSFQLNFRFCFALLIFPMQIISTQQIEQFWCLKNYKLLVSAEKQLEDPLFSSYSKVEHFLDKVHSMEGLFPLKEVSPINFFSINGDSDGLIDYMKTENQTSDSDANQEVITYVSFILETELIYELIATFFFWKHSSNRCEIIWLKGLHEQSILIREFSKP